MIELLSDPNYINQRLLLVQMEYKEQVNKHHKTAYTILLHQAD